jgi:hypothetical protein
MSKYKEDGLEVPRGSGRTPMPRIDKPIRNVITAEEFRKQLAERTDLLEIFESARNSTLVPR